MLALNEHKSMPSVVGNALEVVHLEHDLLVERVDITEERTNHDQRAEDHQGG